MNEDNQNQGMNNTGMNQNTEPQNNGSGSYNEANYQNAQNGGQQNFQGNDLNGNNAGADQGNASGQTYNFKTPEYGRNDHYGQSSNNYGGTNNGQNAGMNNGQNSNNYGGTNNHQNTNYYGGPNYGQGPQGRPPRKHSEFAKELGHFAAKAAIAAVIGVAALAVAGTIALNATNKNVYIVDKNKQVTVGNSGNNSSGGFPFGSFGFGGPGSSEGNNGGNGGSGNNGSNGNNDNGGDSSNNESQQSDNDGPKLGIKVESMPDKLAQAGYPEGVLVAEVTKGGAADKAGLKTGDVITAFNGTVVKSADELVEQVQNVKAGDTVKVNYKRMENGTFKAYDADVTFSEQSDSSSTENKNTESDSSDTQSQDSSEGTESN